MVCEVKIIEDSKNPITGTRLTTFQLKYWRSIHGEFMTHRAFSRNASSSRAIPINTFLKQVWNDPAGPIHWGANQPGMKARTELTGFKKWFARHAWTFTGKVVCSFVWIVNKLVKPHKQTFNRLLEPWQYISVIVTATDWDNWFALRDHPDAQPEICELAQKMRKEMNKSTPVVRDCHLPYVKDKERMRYDESTCMKISTARCARVSYLTHDGKVPVFEKDMQLYNDLVGSTPIHASPTEHPAKAQSNDKYIKNFRGWKQHRVDVELTIDTLKQK